MNESYHLTFQVSKLRHKKVQQIAQGHQQWITNSNPRLWPPESVPLATMIYPSFINKSEVSFAPALQTYKGRWLFTHNLSEAKDRLSKSLNECIFQKIFSIKQTHFIILHNLLLLQRLGEADFRGGPRWIGYRALWNCVFARSLKKFWRFCEHSFVAYLILLGFCKLQLLCLFVYNRYVANFKAVIDKNSRYQVCKKNKLRSVNMSIQVLEMCVIWSSWSWTWLWIILIY